MNTSTGPGGESLAEIGGCLRDELRGAQLREHVLREAGRYMVALLPLTEPQAFEPGATGILVSFLNSRYILTAAHVWDKSLKNALRIGVTLKEKVDHKCLLDTKLIVPFGPPKPAKWNKWGPDIVLLSIPPTDAARIEALGRGSFYNLSKLKRIPSGYYIEERLLIGCPEVLAKYEGAHAELCVNGMFLPIDTTTGTFSTSDTTEANNRADFDYVDADVGYQGALEDFGGVSGGGLWSILYYKSAQTGEIESFNILEGVAFFHLAEPRVIRCHGPQSIGTTLRFLFGPARS